MSAVCITKAEETEVNDMVEETSPGCRQAVRADFAPAGRRETHPVVDLNDEIKANVGVPTR